MIFYKVNMYFDLGDISIKGSGYTLDKPQSFRDISHLIPKWVFEFCKSRGDNIVEKVAFHSFYFDVSKSDVIDLLNPQETFTVHDVYEEVS